MQVKQAAAIQDLDVTPKKTLKYFPKGHKVEIPVHEMPPSPEKPQLTKSEIKEVVQDIVRKNNYKYVKELEQKRIED